LRKPVGFVEAVPLAATQPWAGSAVAAGSTSIAQWITVAQDWLHQARSQYVRACHLADGLADIKTTFHRGLDAALRAMSD
jgi:hypothetical protein